MASEHPLTATSTSLLEGVRALDSQAWRRMVELYGPLVYRWCRRWHLGAEDSKDVVQEVFGAVATHVRDFQRDNERGGFRAWLFTITRNKIRDFFRRRGAEPCGQGGHTGEVWAVAWSRDGAMLATAGLDGTVRTWTADGKPLRVLTKTAAQALSVSFAPDGLLAVCSYDGRVLVWDSATGRPRWVLAMLDGGQTATYTAAGQLIAGDAEAMEKSLRYVVQPEDGDERTMKPSEFYTHIRQVPAEKVTDAETPRPAPAQGKVVWTIGRDGEPLPGIVPRPAQLPGIPRWQVQFPKPSEAVIDGGCYGVRCVRWAPDGQLLAVGDGSGRLYLFSPTGQWLRAVKSHLDGINRLAWSADGQPLASTSKDGTVRLWTRELRPVCLIRNSQGPTLGAAWDPATKRLATSDSEGRIRIWDADGRQLAHLQGNAWLWGLAWSPDGKWLVSDDGVWDAQLNPGPALVHDGEVVDVAWSPDGRLLAAVSGATVQILARTNLDISAEATGSGLGAVTVTADHTTHAGIRNGAKVSAGSGPISGDEPASVLIRAIDETRIVTTIDSNAISFEFDDITSSVDLKRDTQAYVQGTPASGKTLDTRGLAKVRAENTGDISGEIKSNLTGKVDNVADDLARAFLASASIDTGGLDVRALSSASYAASAKEAVNAVSGGTEAYVTGSTIAAGGSGVTVIASDTSSVSAESTELAIDIDALVVDTSLATAVARNELDRSTTAYVDSSTVTATGGDVAVRAENDGTIAATARATAVSDSAVIPGSYSLGLGGIFTANLILGGVDAHITGGSVRTVNSGEIRVEAADTSAIDATTELSVQAKTPNISFGDTGVTSGVSIAFNAIGWKFENFGGKTIETLLAVESGDRPQPLDVKAYIRDAAITAAEDLVLSASSSAQVNATVSNAAETTSSSLFKAHGVSSSGILASNLVSTEAHAFIDYSGATGTVTVGGSLTLTADDAAGIYANSKVVSTSITTNDGGANVLNRELAHRRHDYKTDDGVKDLKFGDRVLLAKDYKNGGKADRVYQYMGTAATGAGLDLGEQDYSDLGWWKEILATQLIPEGNNLSSSDSVALGGLVVRNDAQNEVRAYIHNANVTAMGGDVILQALENATIHATADSTVAASGGSAYGTGKVVAVNGTVATNLMLSWATARIEDSDVTARDVTLDAKNTAGIEALVQNTSKSTDTSVALTVAFNSLGWARQNALFDAVDNLLSTDIGTREPAEVLAYLSDTTIHASRDLSLSAVSDASTKATVGNESTSAAAALYGATGLATSGVLASNEVSSLAKAYINFTGATLGSVQAGVALSLVAEDTAAVDAGTRMLASSTTMNDAGASLLNNFAVSLMQNYQYTTNSGVQKLEEGEKVRLADD